MGLPQANQDGLLPHDVRATFAEIRESFLISGIGYSQRGVRWDSGRRLKLLSDLELTIDAIERGVGGIRRWWIGGSFVEIEPSPTDIDCYFEVSDVSSDSLARLEAELTSLSPDGLYSLDDRYSIPCHGPVRRRPLWCHRKVDLSPETGAPCGIYGPNRVAVTISEAFRQRKVTYQPKGIIELVR